MMECAYCRGSGFCIQCNGTGDCADCDGRKCPTCITGACVHCVGSGRCNDCKGTGKSDDEGVGMIIEKVLEQLVLGYDENGTKTHYQHTVRLVDGKIKTLYSTNTHGKDGSSIIGTKTEIKPYVAQPQKV